MARQAIYYTDNRLDPVFMKKVQKQLRKAFDGEIIACSLEPIDFGDIRIVLPLERSPLTMFKQILACLEASTADVIYHTEHDVLYDASHFQFDPEPDKMYYDINWWKIGRGDLAVHWDAAQVSGLCAYRELLLDWYRERVRTYDPENFDRKYEPTVDTKYETWKAPVAHIDVRHGKNLTYDKWGLQHFRDKSTAVNFEQTTIDKIPDWDLDGIL